MKGHLSAFAGGLAVAGAAAIYVELQGRTQLGKRRPQRETQAADEAGLIDLNSAEKEELLALPGVGPVLAGRILEHRPYRNKMDLLSQMVLPEHVYEQVKHQVMVTLAAARQPVKIAT